MKNCLHDHGNALKICLVLGPYVHAVTRHTCSLPPALVGGRGQECGPSLSEDLSTVSEDVSNVNKHFYSARHIEQLI